MLQHSTFSRHSPSSSVWGFRFVQPTSRGAYVGWVGGGCREHICQPYHVSKKPQRTSKTCFLLLFLFLALSLSSTFFLLSKVNVLTGYCAFNIPGLDSYRPEKLNCTAVKSFPPFLLKRFCGCLFMYICMMDGVLCCWNYTYLSALVI